MGKIGTWELLLILGILVLLFGAAKLPAIGRGLGEGIRNFKDSFRDGSGGSAKEEDKSDKKVR
ncbi:MAG: twin-arginine translocase TatA/TatE family subunit [Candidatus Polarisedimenticolia bacterium]